MLQSLLINSYKTELHFGVKHLKIDKSMCVLYSFVWNYVKYTNTEGFCRDSHKFIRYTLKEAIP